MHKIPISVFSFVRQMFRPHRKWFLLALIPQMCWALENSFTPYVLKRLIDMITGFQGSKLALVSYVMPAMVAYGGLACFTSLYSRLWDYIHMNLYPNIRKDVSLHIYSYLLGHSHAYFQNSFAGSLQNRIGEATDAVPELIYIVEEGISQVFMLLIAFGMLATVHPAFSLILFVWLVTFLLTSWLFSKRVEQRSHAFAKTRTQYRGNLVDSITNALNMRLFASKKYEIARTEETIDEVVRKDRALHRTNLYMRILWDISIISMMIGFIYTLVWMYSRELVSIGDFTFVIMLGTRIFYRVWWFVKQLNRASEHMGKCKQALTILNAPHEVTDRKDAKALQVTKGEITFENVTFHYKKGKNIFTNKNLTIAPGEKIGLVGFSGGGKTTFVNLILRLFDVDKGKIMIDGQDIKTVTKDSLREHISMIPQDTSLFHRSLTENIRYGSPDATGAQVIEAAKKADCHDFIMQLSEKYDTLVGERGIKLSGGQRQRIAIARAILKNAPILILDEATSSLDSITENHIQNSLTYLMKDCTTIVIAHRLSTLAQMDRILVFDKGIIIEEGTHKELIKKKGHYAHLWSMQAGGFLSAGA